MTTSANPDDAPATTRVEWVVAALLLACGFALRGWVAAHSAVEHFDEAVYASNIFFGPPDYHYPFQHLYAPPLLPMLIEAGSLFGISPNAAAIAPSLLAGCATLVVLWRLARRWFGPAAGLATLAIASLSDFHALYSAAALTDVLLGLWVLLAVGAISRAYSAVIRAESVAEEVQAPSAREGKARRDARPRQRPEPPTTPPSRFLRGDSADKWTVVAGLLAGAAWWTKYNGWLALAIAGGGLVLMLLREPIARRRWLRLAACFTLMAVVAAIAWTPVVVGLQDDGGYSAVAANHGRYVVGFKGWLASAGHHIRAQGGMQGVMSLLGLGLACLVACLMAERSLRRWWLAMGVAVLLVVVAYWATTLLVIGLLAATGLAWVAFSPLRASETRQRLDERSVGLYLVAAWWLGLLAATPNYWPYPRLTMLWVIASWFGAGACIALVVRQARVTGEDLDRSTGRLPLAVASVMLVSLAIAWLASAIGPHPLSGSLLTDRGDLQSIAYQVQAIIHSQMREAGRAEPYIVDVAGEPGLFYQLNAAGSQFVFTTPVARDQPAMSPSGEPVPTYLVVGTHALNDPEFQSHWRQVSPAWEPLTPEGLEYHPSLLVRLDEVPRPEKPADPKPPRIWLYRMLHRP